MYVLISVHMKNEMKNVYIFLFSNTISDYNKYLILLFYQMMIIYLFSIVMCIITISFLFY